MTELSDYYSQIEPDESVGTEQDVYSPAQQLWDVIRYYATWPTLSGEGYKTMNKTVVESQAHHEQLGYVNVSLFAALKSLKPPQNLEQLKVDERSFRREVDKFAQAKGPLDEVIEDCRKRVEEAMKGLPNPLDKEAVRALDVAVDDSIEYNRFFALEYLLTKYGLGELVNDAQGHLQRILEGIKSENEQKVRDELQAFSNEKDPSTGRPIPALQAGMQRVLVNLPPPFNEYTWLYLQENLNERIDFPSMTNNTVKPGEAKWGPKGK